jgi:uncharacterized membrane protein
MRTRNLRAQTIALVATLVAVTFVGTMVRVMYIPPTGGYIHLGDVAANFASLAFGPWVGMVASGVGMAIADAIGFPLYIVPTLIVHGLQGLVVGLLGWRKPLPMKVAAAVLGQVIVVAGYFIAQIALGFGKGAALFEAPWNALQGLVGVVGGVALFFLVEKAYPPISQLGRRREWQEDEELE